MPTLNWLTRDTDIHAAAGEPYRLPEEATDLSGGDLGADKMLIQGDEMEALKALLPFNAGNAKCLYIDPPFEPGEAFEHYDDNAEHPTWSGLMYARLNC